MLHDGIKSVNTRTEFLRSPNSRRTLGYYLLILCLGLNTAVFGPTLAALAQQTQAQIGDMGQIFFVGAIGAVLGTFFGGRLFDRFNGHIVLSVVQIIAGLIVLSVPFISSLNLLLVAIVVKGAMEGTLNNGVNTMLVWTHKEKVSPYMNGLHFCFGLGAFLAPLLIAQVIDQSGAYRWVYVGLGFLTILTGLLLSLVAGRSPATHPAKIQSETPPQHIPYSVIFTAALFLFFYVGSEIAFGGWIYTYAVELKLLPAAQAAYLTSGFWLAFTLGRLISVPLATRLAPRQMIAFALAGGAICMGLLFAFADSTSILWLAALGVGFCMAPIYPSGFTLAVSGLHLTARSSGVILLGDSFGGMLLPWLVGQVLGVAGPRAMVYLVLGSLLCDSIAFVALLRARSNLVKGNMVEAKTSKV